MLDNNPLISVIVPVYNVEKYLKKCIDSILMQTYSNLEIILVDDGSPDNCPMICDEYSKKDSRIKVIHKTNGGLSSARNAGLDIATGDYIGFIDSDDYISPNMFSKLYESISYNNSDISICNYKIVSDDGNIITNNLPITNEIITGFQAIQKLELKDGVCFVMMCNKLFSSKLFKEIRFPNNKIGEDNYIIHNLYFLCEKVSLIKDELYYYLQRSNSILHSEYTIKNADIVEGFYCRIQFLESKGLTSNINVHYHQFLWAYRDFKCNYKNNSLDTINRIDEIDKMAYAVCNKLGSKNFNWKERVFFSNNRLYIILLFVKNKLC